MKVKRRRFLRCLLPAVACSGMGAFSVYQYARRIEPNHFKIEFLSVPTRNLGHRFVGFRIVQLSDIHLHPYTRIDLIKKAVSIANDLKPDLVVLTGDYVFTSADSIFELAPVLSRLNALHGVIGGYPVFGCMRCPPVRFNCPPELTHITLIGDAEERRRVT